MSVENQPLQFVPFASSLDAAFWYKLSQLKLNVYRLDDSPILFRGSYTNHGIAGFPPLVNVDSGAFSLDKNLPQKHFQLTGKLCITNTLNEFKEKDKNAFLKECSKHLWNAVTSGDALKQPSLLSTFECLAYADLKKYQFYYWFAFPTLNYPSKSYLSEKPSKIGELFSENQINLLKQCYDDIEDSKKQQYFLVHVATTMAVSIYPLESYISIENLDGELYLAFSDPSKMELNPGWPLRNLLALFAFTWPAKTEWKVLCYREQHKDGLHSIKNSIVISVKLEINKEKDTVPTCTGWERNQQKQLGPRMVDLRQSMDPCRIAENAVDLNLKLMRWRIAPDIEVEKIMATKCLLLGAGTLGCSVARCLLGWGVRTITFVDNSKVSYSNPVRQTLYNFEDCLGSGKPKAEAAASNLAKIFPGVKTEGFNMSIPMPGHVVSPSEEKDVKETVEKLEDMISKHDVIYLLMDSRESRWLPTVIASAQKKLVINAALGYDTYIVMRHGVKEDFDVNKTHEQNIKHIPGNYLGCYFCNDVVAPGNSTQDRTLDQQCTVTRPGISMIAAATAVELMVSVLQHPLSVLAPGDISEEESFIVEKESPLGIVPHQIRGFLSSFSNILPSSLAFQQCTACSMVIQDAYLKEKFLFLMQVFNDPKYLEKITGLSDLHYETDLADWPSDDES